MKRYNRLINQVLQLTRNMIILADEGIEAAQDDGCRLLYGVIQDCAYKIRVEAERERERHQKSGKWEEDKSAVHQARTNK